jgi:hypothetical protein
MRAMDAEMKLDRLAAALPSAPASVLLPGGGGGGNVSKLVYDGDVVEPRHDLVRWVVDSASGATCVGIMELKVTHEPKPSQTLEYAPLDAVVQGKP